MSMYRRIHMVQAFLSPTRDFPVSSLALLRGVFRTPAAWRGPRVIRGLKRESGYVVVELDGLDAALYWPEALPLHHLHMMLAEAFYDDDWHFYEVPETQIHAGDVVLDCGAAEGLFSLRASARAGRVFAFEPSPQFVASLQRTFAAVANVTVVPKALGAADGEAFLDAASIESVVSRDGCGASVQLTTVDRWVDDSGTRVDFIKADVEAFEMEVLLGAAKSIAKFKPRIAITTYHPGNDWRQMLSFCRSLVPSYRYRVKGLSRLDGKQARPVMLHLWAP
jgi:FkbM family methyltransferase